MAKKCKGNSFRKGTTIKVYKKALLEEYRSLLDRRDQLALEKKQAMALLKVEKADLKKRKALLEKDSEAYKLFLEEEKKFKALEKQTNEKLKNEESKAYSKPYSHFKSLTTCLKYYEILDNVRLIIHIHADSETLQIIEDNVYNIKAIGRSEDFVDIEEVERITLRKCEEELTSNYSAYIPHKLLMDEQIYLGGVGFEGGTKYYLNKNYEFLKDRKTRVFTKCKVVYGSKYETDDACEDVWIDESKKEKYIVLLM